MGADLVLLREQSAAEIEALLGEEPIPRRENWADGYPLEGTTGGATLVQRTIEAGTYRPGFGMYQVIDRRSGLVVGDIGFHSAPDRRGSVEIGYGLVEAFRGRGIATNAMRALVKWALRQPQVTEIRAETEEDHRRSQAVLTRSGFVL
ncbi:MAG: GNAT family N-acetyltransferase, partial [Actinobacteria bacterium]|nr:GNAT family N-acetyltransferase [Actinomycetota bacterium]